MPSRGDFFDLRIIVAVTALQTDYTILPMIVAETYMSVSYCHSFRGRVFQGSSVLLYIWFMSHLKPIGRFRRQGFCFSHSLTMQFSFRPHRCYDAVSWTDFLSAIEDPFHLLVYSGYSSFMSFLTHVPLLDFIPIPGLRGVTTYHPLSVLGQFNQLQDFHSYAATSDYRFIISPQTEADLLRVYDLWSCRISAEFSDSCPGQTPAYREWLCGDMETTRVEQAVTQGGSSGIHQYADNPYREAPSTLPDLMARPEVDGQSTFSSTSGSNAYYRVPTSTEEGYQLRSALCTIELERDTARYERDAAILARDAALSARDTVVLQTRAVIDTHLDTVSRAAALLDRVDMVGQQAARDSDTSDSSATLSLLLQLISDL